MKEHLAFNAMLLMAFVFPFLPSCNDTPSHDVLIENADAHLPEELKGMKVYRVQNGWDGNNFLVAIVPNSQTTSLSYLEGKNREYVLVVEPQAEPRHIKGQILSENDSLIVIRLMP